MARNKRTAEEIDAIALQLSEASDAVKAIAQLIRQNNLPDVLIHGSATLNKDLPGVLKWIDRTTADVKIQVREYLAGEKLSAEIVKEQNEKQKLAAAKKAARKKAT